MGQLLADIVEIRLIFTFADLLIGDGGQPEGVVFTYPIVGARHVQPLLPVTARESRPLREGRVFRPLRSEPRTEQGGRESRAL
jgi:hypothetical protein